MNFSYEDSPTRKVNYQVVNQLKKVEHNHKMLSLDKTKSLEDVIAFSGDKQMLVMAKLDGLTCSLKYINGRLVSAETRGDGIIGEDILHNALVIPSIPNRINYTEELIVDGEIVCLEKDFAPFKKEYKNSRNFAAGSIRLLDSKECAKRNLTFIVWDVIKGFDGDKRAYPERNMLSYKLIQIEDLGFTVVPKSCFYLREHPTEKELLTHTQIVDIVREKYDICSKKNNNTSGAPKFFISDLLAIFNDECDRVFYTYYGSTGYYIKRIFTGIDSIEAVFDKIDKLLNDNAAIYVITKNNDYLLTRSAVRITNEIRKNAPQIDIYDLI